MCPSSLYISLDDNNRNPKLLKNKKQLLLKCSLKICPEMINMDSNCDVDNKLPIDFLSKKGKSCNTCDSLLKENERLKEIVDCLDYQVDFKLSS